MPSRSFEVNAGEYPFESHWFERGDDYLHYIDEGLGEGSKEEHAEQVPVVFCHGNPTWSFLYRNIIKKLRSECRCIAHDLPGFGFSSHPKNYDYKPQSHVEWLEAFWFEHLKLEKFILVCQDWGGPIGFDIATRHPDKITGVVASSTWAWKSATVGTIFSGLLGNPLGQKLILSKNIFAAGLVPMMMPKSMPNREQVIESYIAPFPTPESRMGTAVFPKQINAAKPWLSEIEPRLSALSNKPMEFVFGLKDLGTLSSDINRWLSHFPDAGVQKDAKANHFTQEDCPELYVKAVRNILRSL